VNKSWSCPFCGRDTTITDSNVSGSVHAFSCGNSEDVELWLDTSVIVCPNDRCRQYVVEASLFRTSMGSARRKRDTPAIANWTLRPKSLAKILPDYIPKPIIDDYEEACLILVDSPKASATLSRRCLQGMIRDYWKISKPRLIEEINALRGIIDESTWYAIDAVRSIGNIGAHMERDIDLIIDVDPGESAILIQLLETLFKEWYINRFERDQQMKQIVAIAQSKQSQKSPPAQPSVPNKATP
jgi:hypothetical protein